MNLPRMVLLLAVGLVTSAVAAPPDASELAGKSPTIARILQRGRIVVGSGFKFRTFNYKNAETGENEGFLVDVSRALAKRLLGDVHKVEFRYAAGNMGSGNVLYVVRG